MGVIQVGHKSPKTIDMGGFTSLDGETVEHTDADNVKAGDDNTDADGDGHGDGDENQVHPETGESSDVGAASDLSEILKKKPGRPKKSDSQ